MSKTINRGRLGNTIFRSIAASIICEKFNLKIEYYDYDKINKLGILLFDGENVYNKKKRVKNKNYFKILNKKKIKKNLIFKDYFQIKETSNLIHKYLNRVDIMNNIINKNNYKQRYNKNNDCFVHIRLGDVAKYNPGYDYYNNIIKNLNVDKIYISSDTINHNIIKKLKKQYNNIILFKDNPINTILFGSTCKYVILSYGTFSATIGYLSYYSNVYYFKTCKKYKWESQDNNYFSNKYSKICSWNEIILN